MERLLDPVARCLTPDAAREVAALRADYAVQARIDELADKATEDDLSPKEKAEYDTYVRALDFIAVLQAKARIAINNRGAA